MKITYLATLLFLVPITVFSVSTGELIQTASESFAKLIFLIPGVVFGIGLRGAFIAKKVIVLGDHFSQKGRSWNPMDYLDPTGSLAGLFFMFGWPHHPDFDRRMFKNPGRDEWRLYFSASLFNLFMGLIGLLMLYLITNFAGGLPEFVQINVSYVFSMFTVINLMIAIYSFLPFFPLPGYDLLYRHLSPLNRHKLDHYRSVTMLILMILLFLFNAYLITPVFAVMGLLLKINPVVLGFVCLLMGLWLFLIELKVRVKE